MSPMFRFALGVIAALVLSLAGTAAVYAGTATLTCTPPTANTDGSQISGAISYRFVWGTSATNLTNSVNSSTCGAVVTVPDPAAGQSVTYHFAVHAIVSGVESARSAVVTKTFSTPNPIPNPPTGLRVVEPVAYRLDAGSHNKVLFTKIGTVALDTPCNAAYSATVSGVTRNIVDRKLVTPVGVLPYQVWAKCAA